MYNSNKSDDYKNLNFKNNKRKKKNSNLNIIVVIISAIVFGFLVFFISNLFFGNKTNKKTTTNEPINTEISINSKQVKDLYSYVTYGTNDKNYNLFIKNKKVTQGSISNLDKYLYALQFVTKEDFKDKSTAEDKIKVYAISNAKVQEYMKNLFGSEVEYVTTSEIPITLDFDFNNENTGKLIYDNKLDAYKISFTEKINKNNEDIIKPYYRVLNKAYKASDNSINIVENIVYVTYSKTKDNLYNYEVYTDYEHTIIIDSKENMKQEDIKNSLENLKDYKNVGATITYTFKPDKEGNYYFYSSKIDY